MNSGPTTCPTGTFPSAASSGIVRSPTPTWPSWPEHTTRGWPPSIRLWPSYTLTWLNSYRTIDRCRTAVTDGPGRLAGADEGDRGGPAVLDQGDGVGDGGGDV